MRSFGELKVALLCRGIKLGVDIDKGRKGGAGPAGGRYIILPSGRCVNAAMWGRFVEKSPYVLVKRNKKFYVVKDSGEEVSEVDLVPYPQFYRKYTSDGTPMWKVALLHGSDCLATTVFQKCVYWSKGLGCKFCGIELSLKYGKTILLKKAREFREVVDTAVEEGVCKHITLTTGTLGTPDKGANLLAEIVREVKSHYEIPIHVQLEPPNDLKYLEELADAGADTVGVHIETFDKKIFHEVCPGKGRIGMEKFYETWARCVELFGESQVSTYVIVGLGESVESVLKGSKKAAEMGVIPYIVPLRPIIGTPFENKFPPSPDTLTYIYREVAQILKDYGVDPRKNLAGCVRCGACSALTEAYEKSL